MSLAPFLLGSGKKKAVDTELDAIFHTQTPLQRPESTPNDRPVLKKQKKRRLDVHNDEPDIKRPKPSTIDASLSLSSPGKPRKDVKRRVRIDPRPISIPNISNATVVKRSKNVPSHESGLRNPDGDEGHPPILIHETIQKVRPSKPEGKKAKYAPPDETQETRNARTIFVGNLPPEVAVQRPLQKQLRRHILALLPTAKIESTRFRSVAFQTPMSKPPKSSDETKKDKQPRQHDQDRASSWRDAHATDESKANEKKFLTPSQKKKIAFINGDIHSDADSVHAYIVFAYPSPPQSRPTNLPPLTPAMDPFEAAHLAIEKCDGTMFLDRILRVDAVVKMSTAEILSDSPLLSSAIGDPKLTIFVGNLDFTSREEDLRAFFEGVVSAERGPPDAKASQDGDKTKYWVTRVRLVRDKDTQLGKGFAYVQFSDRTCVDEVLALEQGKLKFAKRKLRVQRCKTIPNTSNKDAPPSKPTQASSHIPVPPVPKGDPTLGAKLNELTKEERKRVKAADADRVARRVAKKKARMALAKQGASVPHKQRERLRKTSVAKQSGSAPSKKASKGRVRSEKSIAKMNTKK